MNSLFKQRPIFLLLLLTLFPLRLHAASDAGVKLNIHRPVVRDRTFDRNHMPSDMPKLHNNEAAATVSEFAATTDVQVLVLDKSEGDKGCNATVKVTGVTFEPSLAITIWLPNDATQKLRDHENG